MTCGRCLFEMRVVKYESLCAIAFGWVQEYGAHNLVNNIATLAMHY